MGEGCVVSAFQARHEGKCVVGCGGRIDVGDAVVYVEDELVHAECEGAAIRNWSWGWRERRCADRGEP